MAQEIAQELNERWPQQQVELHVRGDTQAHGDPQLLRIALENLLGNSWKFMGDQEAPRVELGVTYVDSSAVYHLKDNGVGFDMAYAAKLFVPFQRLQEPNRFEGRGIGFATVQRIVQRHGGQIWADASPGEGATFSFTLEPSPRPVPSDRQRGYNSSSRFCETTDEVLGMTPSKFRAGDTDAEIPFAIGEFSLGSILVARSERGICAILLGDDPEALAHELENRFPQANLVGANEEFEQVVATVVAFVEAPGIGLDLPLDVRGTAFQQRVWKALREIPVGATSSYSEIARRLDAPKGARAVAQACGANALAVAIPCHRVVRNNGGLSGYRWGVERKRVLLDREKSG
ncbi:MAG: methylated-DNA--[protein]-cysteine S-methyltransferase [Trueperaceae bacterium]